MSNRVEYFLKTNIFSMIALLACMGWSSRKSIWFYYAKCIQPCRVMNECRRPIIRQNISAVSWVIMYLAFAAFGKLVIVFSAKTNLLYFFYLMVLWCCLLRLRKQNCLLKSFLRTLLLTTLVSRYLLSLLKLIWNCLVCL